MSAAAAQPGDPAIRASWDANADAWTDAVRRRAIATRAVTDEAIVEVIRQVPTGPILDMGCGEGWLARRLAAEGHRVTGIDGSEALVRRARELGGGDFRAVPYDQAVEAPRLLKGPYGTVVFNFSLFDEKITRVLDAVSATLFPYGRILIQTLHPATASAGGEYRDGWRTEDFAGMGFPAAMPWYFRTFSTWVLEIRRAGLVLVETYEPLDDAGRPVSLILHATIPEKRRG